MKYHYFEALASLLVVGSGQIIQGETNKGILILLTFYFILPALVYGTLLINGEIFTLVFGICVISAIILWLYSIGEALLKNEKNI